MSGREKNQLQEVCRTTTFLAEARSRKESRFAAWLSQCKTV
jgi:hypothetical protein